jgi:hypothetical protein
MELYEQIKKLIESKRIKLETLEEDTNALNKYQLEVKANGDKNNEDGIYTFIIYSKLFNQYLSITGYYDPFWGLSCSKEYHIAAKIVKPKLITTIKYE